MSLSYKFDKLNEQDNKNKSGDISKDGSDILRYDTSADTRILHLVDTTGNHTCFNYSYLISGEFSPEENTIKLFFTTRTITLKGQNLGILFDDLLIQLPKKITCIDQRYISLKDKSDLIVTDLTISEIT